VLTKPTIFLSALLVFVFLFAAVASAFFDKENFIPPGQVKSEATRSAKGKAKLEAAKLKVCERKEDQIQRRSDRIAQRAQLIENRFGRIAERIEEFYTNKLVPNGGTIANYDSLVEAIAAQKAAVDTALTGAKTAADDFDCSGDNPKGELTTFRGEMKTVISALNTYKKSIIDLLVAVRTKGKNIKTTGATSSATP